MVYRINALPQWHDYYEAEAKAFLRQCSHPSSAAEIRRSLLNDHLKNYAQRTLSFRAHALQNSAIWAFVVQGTAAAGGVPLGKILVKSGGALLFASKALKSFGIDKDMDEELFAIAIKAKLIETDPDKMLKSQVKKELKKVIKSGAKDFWEKENMADYIKDELKEECKDEAAVEGIEEFVHCVPVLGQMWSYGVGYYRAERKLINVLDKVIERAHEVHDEVLIPLICHSLVKDQLPAPLIPTMSPSQEEKTTIPSLPETKITFSLTNVTVTLTCNYICKITVRAEDEKKISFLIGLPPMSRFQILLLLVFTFSIPSIVQQKQVFECIWGIMVSWWIFSFLYYFRRAILPIAGLIGVGTLALIVWGQIIGAHVF
ncbi:hypothetical protein L873DRAFT_24461 [Choiromyces venosus 120613-1]|uniref:Uncharacterized protein n=1 Tax=Choiromyces venosus 120613-1 TaxID=1336337 RepID=A0A3N4K6E4_9PEZI|nr:hypothetical protein L873DRAFT_24461 [Choiromyces venosus 120613-1]